MIPLVGSKTGSRMSWNSTGSRNSSGISPKDASDASYNALDSTTALSGRFGKKEKRLNSKKSVSTPIYIYA